MITDARLLFSDAQALTATAASDSVIDLGVARDIGTGEELYVCVSVDVAFSDSNSDSTITVALEGDSTESFSPDGTADLFIIPALAAVGNVYFARLNPGMTPLQYRYIRLKYTTTNGNLTTGSVTASLVHGIQKYVSYADAITIS